MGVVYHDPTIPPTRQDADNDGAWDCSGGVVFITTLPRILRSINASMSSFFGRASNLVDCSGEQYQVVAIKESL